MKYRCTEAFQRMDFLDSFAALYRALQETTLLKLSYSAIAICRLASRFAFLRRYLASRLSSLVIIINDGTMYRTYYGAPFYLFSVHGVLFI